MKTRILSTARLSLPLAAAMAAFLGASSASAAPLTWDNGAATGNWNTTELNWTGSIWNNATPDDAVFGATGVGTVTLTEAITAGSITFNTVGYTINTSTFGLTLNTGITANQNATIQSGTGGGIILGANNVWSVASSRTLTVSSVISGATFGITKSGAGTLALSGPNTYGGDTTLNGGTVAISNATSFGGGDVLVTGNTRINASALNYANDISIDASRVLSLQNTGAANSTATFSGAITGSGGITLVQAANSGAAINLSSTNNTFTGNVTLPSASGTNDFIRFASIGDGGSIVFGRSSWRANVTYTGAANMTWNTRTISLATTFGGSSGLDGGGNPIHMFANNGAGTVTINTAMGMTSIASSGILFLGGSNTGNNTFAGAIADPTGANTLGIGKYDAGKWILSNNTNSFEGNVFLAAGTLSVGMIDVAGNAQPLGKGSLIQLGYRNADIGTLEYTGSVNAVTNKQIEVGRLSNSTNGNFTGGGVILNNGAGTLTFSNATFNSTAGVPVTGTGIDRNLTLSGTNSSLNTISGTIRDNNAAIGAQVSLTKTGTGTWVLAGTNTYTLATIVSQGLLGVTGSLTSNVTVANTATLFGTGTTTGTLALSNGSTIVGTSVGNSFKAQTVTAASSVGVAGSDGSGSIGSHTIGVVRYNAGTGPITANFSTAGYRSATIGNVGTSGGETQLAYINAARTWNSASGTWDAMTTNAWQEDDFKYSQGDAVTFDDSGTGGGGARAVILNSLVTPGSVTFNNTTSTPYTVSGTGMIAGLTGLTKSGNGTVTLENTNIYSGDTSVAGGTLLVNGSTASTSAVSVDSGATLGGTGIVGGIVEVTGSIAPGTNGIGTLKSGSVNWNGNASSSPATDWKFDLGSDNASDKLEIAGDFAKGTGDAFWFDFLGSNATGTFDLVSWTGLSGFALDASDFSYTNLGGGNTGSFSITGSTLQFTAIPEPSTALGGLLLTAGLLRRRRVHATA